MRQSAGHIVPGKNLMRVVIGLFIAALCVPILSLQVSAAEVTPPIVINEVQPGVGSEPKWIELYNTSDEVVDISNLRVYRGAGVSALGGVIPSGTELAAHSYYLLEFTAVMPLDSGGLALELWTGTRLTGVQIDSVDYEVVPGGSSYGRVYDGAATFRVFDTPTPDATNYVTPPSAPTDVHLRNSEGRIGSGQLVNYSGVTLRWNAVSGENIGNYRVRAQSPNGTITPYPEVDGTSYSLGSLLNAQGRWTFSVSVQDTLTGEWSSWSDPTSLIYDTVAPSVSITSPVVGGHYSTTFTVSGTAQDANGIQDQGVCELIFG